MESSRSVIGSALCLLLGAMPASTHPGIYPPQGSPVVDAAPRSRDLALVVIMSPSGRRLTLLRDRKEAGTIAVPNDVSDVSLARSLKSFLSHPSVDAVAAAFRGEKQSFVVLFLQQKDGGYLGVDLSGVEHRNLGVIGPNRRYREVETTPVGWVERSDDSVQVRLRTRATDDAGKRYSATEPLLVTRDGRVGWR